MQLNSVNLIYQVTRCNISKSFLFITIQEGQSYIYRKHCAHSSLYTLVYVNLTKHINIPVEGEQKLLKSTPIRIKVRQFNNKIGNYHIRLQFTHQLDNFIILSELVYFNKSQCK